MFPSSFKRLAYVCPPDVDVGTGLHVELERIARAVQKTVESPLLRVEVHQNKLGALAVHAVDASPILLPEGLMASAAAKMGWRFADLVTMAMDRASPCVGCPE